MSGDTAKKKPRGKPFTGKDDPRRSNGGRKSSDNSPTYWLKELMGLTGEQAADRLTLYSKELRKLGKDVPIAAALMGRTLIAAFNDPDPRMITLLFDRIDGKVAQPFKWEDDLVAWLRDNAETLRTDAAERARVARILREGGNDVTSLFAAVGLEVVVSEDG